MYRLYADEAGDLHLWIVAGKDKNLWINEYTAVYPMGCMMYYLRDKPNAWKRWDSDCFQAKHDHEDIFWSDRDMENLFAGLDLVADQDDLVTGCTWNDEIMSHLRTAGYFKGQKPSKKLVNLVAKRDDWDESDREMFCTMASLGRDYRKADTNDKKEILVEAAKRLHVDFA